MRYVDWKYVRHHHKPRLILLFHILTTQLTLSLMVQQQIMRFSTKPDNISNLVEILYFYPFYSKLQQLVDRFSTFLKSNLLNKSKHSRWALQGCGR